MERIDTLIIGGGQAGLTMSHHLSKRSRAHVVLERGRIAERWRSERWDGLYFQTPNLLLGLPDFPFPHTDPNAYATCQEIVDFLAGYAAFIEAPVRSRVAVTRLSRGNGEFRYVAETSAGQIGATNVVVATGPFQRPIIPALLPATPGVLQLHAVHYRAPHKLPDGAVLVVGSGASGAQIAEELMRAGRRVYLSISKHRRAPRRYRGRDHVWWWVETGMMNTPPERRNPDASPVVHTGAYGGHTIDFRDYAKQGMVLLGRAQAARIGTMTFATDLVESLAHGDAAYLAFMDFVNAHISRQGMDLPEDPEARIITPTPDAFAEPLRQLDLPAAGISTVIWATGYALDFGWIDLPVLDQRGEPIHNQGITQLPGLYFLGLPFLSKLSSSFLIGVAGDAERLAEAIESSAVSNGRQ